MAFGVVTKAACDPMHPHGFGYSWQSSRMIKPLKAERMASVVIPAVLTSNPDNNQTAIREVSNKRFAIV
jgi:hypothetical protein